MSLEQHDIHEENVGAYLLGALTEIELRGFERHMEQCHVCRDELERLRPAAEALPRSVTPMVPPPGLKAALMEAVEADFAEAGEREAPRRPPALQRLGRRLAAIASPRPGLALAGVGLVLLVGVLAGYAATRVSDGDTRTVAARFDGDRVAGGSGSLVISGESKAGATLRVHGMPSLPSNETYEVWLRRDGETIPKALFNVTEDGSGLTAVDGDLEGADAVLVTREPRGGARFPSGKPIVTVSL